MHSIVCPIDVIKKIVRPIDVSAICIQFHGLRTRFRGSCEEDPTRFFCCNCPARICYFYSSLDLFTILRLIKCRIYINLVSGGRKGGFFCCGLATTHLSIKEKHGFHHLGLYSMPYWSICNPHHSLRTRSRGSCEEDPKRSYCCNGPGRMCYLYNSLDIFLVLRLARCRFYINLVRVFYLLKP